MRYSASKPESIRIVAIVSKIYQLVKAIAVGFCLVFSAACSDRETTEMSLAANAAGQTLYQQLITRARQHSGNINVDNSASSADWKPAAFVNEDEPFELWVFLAIVRDQHGDSYAFQQRFARLMLLPHTDSVSTSEWNYSDVMALDYQFDHLADGRSEQYAFAQRAALGLSGVDKTAKRIWVGGFDARQSAISKCHKTIQVTSPKLDLQFGTPGVDQMSCEDIESAPVERVAAFSVSRGYATPVVGQYQVDQQSLELSGHGWVIHGWGAPPDSLNAAVVLDRVWLLLDDKIDVQVQRSKRASGRGPRITTGALYNLDSMATVERGSFSGELTDSKTKSASNLPTSWQLESPNNKLSLTVEPVSSAARVQDLPGQSRFDVVLVHGSHDGYGFIDYNLR